MTDERTDVIVATGGTAVVRSAYSSGNPAIGVGPGNVPVMVDKTAEPKSAAKRIVDSKSFDNSILCTNESVLICEQAAVDNLLRHLRGEGAYLLTDDERDRVREMMFPKGSFDLRFIGKDATFIAAEAGVRVAGNTRILLAPFDLVVPEEPFAHEKLCPVLGFVTVPNTHRGIDAARAVLRITGPGHSAAIHSEDARTIMDYSAALRVLRVAVNVGNSLGSAGMETNLPPTMTVGTGYFGRSSVAENLQPKHLTQWTQVAYNSSPSERFGDFAGMTPWEHPHGHVPPYPVASNLAGMTAPAGDADHPGRGGFGDHVREPMTAEAEGLREEIRRMVLEELSRIVRG